MVKWIYLILLIVFCNALGGIGGIWSASDNDWYSDLNKPSFNPPSWVFGPVWFIMFTLMGIALYFVLFSNNPDFKLVALVLFFVQFIFNVLWSYFFFGLNNISYALADIILLLGLIGLIIFYFFKAEKTAGYLMIPYFFWVCFATILNYSIWRLN
jgi:translocator protein